LVVEGDKAVAKFLSRGFGVLVLAGEEVGEKARSAAVPPVPIG
jgi:hypothetical protein